jgi:hypothetical protein
VNRHAVKDAEQFPACLRFIRLLCPRERVFAKLIRKRIQLWIVFVNPREGLLRQLE